MQCVAYVSARICIHSTISPRQEVPKVSLYSSQHVIDILVLGGWDLLCSEEFWEMVVDC
jgi:hypothetical protein